jgi:hypothetical protein
MQLQVCVASTFSIDLRVRVPIRLFHNDNWSPSAASTPARSILPPAPHPIPAANASAASDGGPQRSPTVSSAAAAAAPPASSTVSSVSDLQLPIGLSYSCPPSLINFL